MNEDIKDKLEEIYTFPLDVEYKDFRQYAIVGQVDFQTFEFIYLYDVTKSLNANVDSISEKINQQIISIFKKARI